jgi:hypothetical protein
MPATKTDLPAAMAGVSTRPLFVMRLDVSSVQKIGTEHVVAQVGVIPGGSFEGERLSGEILDGGSDWQTIRPDGSVLLDCRLMLKTDDGAMIAMTYAGIRAGSPEVFARLAKGEPTDPSEYYFRINPLFHTADARYDWLNRVVAIGVGHRLPTGPIYNVFEVL